MVDVIIMDLVVRVEYQMCQHTSFEHIIFCENSRVGDLVRSCADGLLNSEGKQQRRVVLQALPHGQSVDDFNLKGWTRTK